ncbi:serine/threonine-protein kinase [Serinibacter arcticus]|uniref:serine/threonine-protein kinase n=1 Tax=Serinibacter arcticus TaxID=1655435 RepID=UPI0010918CA4|nr:protein kinase [Serinibacter arcticus]
MAFLGGVSEVAQRLGVSRQRFGEVRSRNDFPQPVAVLSSGPIWDLGEVDRWLGSGVRRSAGRPSARERVVGDRFVLEEPALGAGGFADVFRAVDRRNGEVVAVKILKELSSVDDEAVARFRRELRIMKDELDHPHVAKVIDHGDLSGADETWCAMPLAVGSLADGIASMRGNLASVTDLARQLCAGVGHVHERGILHRDLKPGNVLRSPEGLWQVSDFGLAREDARVSQALTSTLAQGMGTFIYASPEQWQGPKRADVRDDIYSIGKILQHALTGELPLVGADQIPESLLRPVIQRATGPRDNRYADVLALLRAVEQAATVKELVWEEPGLRLERLHPRLAATELDAVAADELARWLSTLDIDAEIHVAAKAFLGASSVTIDYLWSTNPQAFYEGWRHITEWLKFEEHDFAYCDVIADAVREVIQITGSNDVLREGVAALVRVGTKHNRWHVRDVLVDVLQSVRDPERALAGLEGLQEVGPDEVVWSISDFAARTMHPVVRQGIRNIRRRLAS